MMMMMSVLVGQDVRKGRVTWCHELLRHCLYRQCDQIWSSLLVYSSFALDGCRGESIMLNTGRSRVVIMAKNGDRMEDNIVDWVNLSQPSRRHFKSLIPLLKGCFYPFVMTVSGSTDNNTESTGGENALTDW